MSGKADNAETTDDDLDELRKERDAIDVRIAGASPAIPNDTLTGYCIDIIRDMSFVFDADGGGPGWDHDQIRRQPRLWLDDIRTALRIRSQVLYPPTEDDETKPRSKPAYDAESLTREAVGTRYEGAPPEVLAALKGGRVKD